MIKRFITRSAAMLAMLLLFALPTLAGDADITVHITKTGHKYHEAGCRYLKKSDIKVTLKKAKELGLSACSVCDPPS